jgi:serine/threonine protein kinase
MTSERWQAIERLYHAASERPEDSRAAFLLEVCAGDAELRREVESLLAHEAGAAGFMSSPAVMASGAMPGTGESLTGRHLGPYSIRARLGVGGMGEVYKARDTRLDRDVAIKVLTAHIADDPLSRERFQREARAVAALNHPHICTLHDVGAQRHGLPVMEYLDGETLAERLSRSSLPVEKPFAAIQIASALDRA